MEWRNTLKFGSPELEIKKGLSEIKQVELYTKWRKLIPDEFKDEMCPKPEYNVISKVKQQRNDKIKAKKESNSSK